MAEVRVRPATVADGETLLALIDGLAAYEKLTPPDADGRQRFLAELNREPPRMWAYIAEADGGAVGYTVVCETYSTFSMRPKLFLEDIFVVPRARSTGAGLALFRSAVEEAVRRDCSALVWEVLDWNHLAIDFYERIGGQRFEGWSSYRLDREAMRKLLSKDYSARRDQ
ncbi:MAG TPA: GNAT family N-acetyltransferase [Dehalococcoidia bacterium]